MVLTAIYTYKGIYMKKVILPLILGLSLVVLTSCAIFTNKGNSALLEEKSRARIVNVEGQISANTSDKLESIATLAYGTDYALSKVNDPPREVVVARDMNQRVTSIAGSPTLEKMKEMQDTINKLVSMLATERDEGKVKLEAKDQEIALLQTETKNLTIAKENEIRKYMLSAQAAAASADAYKSALQEYQGWFGLKAVGKGLWQFAKSSMWLLAIGGILFLILRTVAMSNPIAASIFSIFNMMGSWVVNIIKVIVPKAVDMAGHVTVDAFNTYKSTLRKIVDGIQIVKDRATAAGKQPDLNLVLDEVAKTMNSDEKAIIEEIKKALNWK